MADRRTVEGGGARLVEAAAGGQDNVIVTAPLGVRTVGGLEGRFTVSEDFDRMAAEEIRVLFEGD